MMVLYCFSPELKFLICRKLVIVGEVFNVTLLLKIIIKFTKLNPEPTAKGSVLKFDKFIYAKSINSEQGDKPLFLGLDNDIIVMSIV